MPVFEYARHELVQRIDELVFNADRPACPRRASAEAGKLVSRGDLRGSRSLD